MTMTHRDAVQQNLLEVSATPRGYRDEYGVISPIKADVESYARNRGYAGVVVVVAHEGSGSHLIPLADFA
jgi:hypothetical protein